MTHSSQFLDVAERGGCKRTMHERADVGGLRVRPTSASPLRPSISSVMHDQRSGPDPLRDGRRQSTRPLLGDLRGAEAAQERAVETREARSRPMKSTAWRPPPTRYALVSSTGAACRTPGNAAPRPAAVRRSPAGCAPPSCRRDLPTIPLVSCSTDPLRLVLATWEANSSATPTPIPRIANSSWTSRARRRTA